MKTLIKGGRLITPAETITADLMIEGEQIALIGKDLPAEGADQVIDAVGLLVMPGGVDVHTHWRNHDRYGLYRSRAWAACSQRRSLAPKSRQIRDRLRLPYEHHAL
jgi:predicted amidohydrolase